MPAGWAACAGFALDLRVPVLAEGRRAMLAVAAGAGGAAVMLLLLSALRVLWYRVLLWVALCGER